MAFTFRPAIREHTPLIIGLAGPTKSGKTYSSLRLATGLANDGVIAMLNAEGPRGHQYADKFRYVACELAPPFRATRYTEALEEAKKIKPAVVIIDSGSHMHDGPGGALEWHEEELDRMAGNDSKKRERSTFAAWVKVKAAETQFIYAMLGMECAVILALRAKEKIKLVKGQGPIDLGWQPIVGERVAFETIFTLMLPPHSKGIPDLSISDMREPFDTMIPAGRQIDEDLGRKLAAWARGGVTSAKSTAPNEDTPQVGREERASGSASAPPRPAAGKAVFTISNKRYETAGMTRDQLLDLFHVCPDFDEHYGEGSAVRLLMEMHPGKKSRTQLTEAEAAAYLDRMRAALEPGAA